MINAKKGNTYFKIIQIHDIPTVVKYNVTNVSIEDAVKIIELEAKCSDGFCINFSVNLNSNTIK